MKSLHEYMEEGNLLEVKKLIKNGAEYNVNTCLTASAYDGFIDLVKYFVTLGADITYNNNEALLNTAYYKHWDIYLYLLEQGANLNNKVIKNAAQISFDKDPRILYDLIEKGYIKDLLTYANDNNKLIIDEYIVKKNYEKLNKELPISSKEESKNKL